MADKKRKRRRCLADTDCQGTVEIQSVTYPLKVGKKTIEVPNVEVWVCQQCGERFYPAESSRKIETYKRYSGLLTVRVDPELHARLARQAQAHHRPLNQEISHLLEQGLRRSA
ncbi:MAG: toxin-antitoxin system HicB family antitoxin [Acidobacteria bacterium]|nr:toxin-antitoxin system HicB family antitoxin [Acidobacteriota bacterium]